jgi:hypothetical protein
MYTQSSTTIAHRHHPALHPLPNRRNSRTADNQSFTQWWYRSDVKRRGKLHWNRFDEVVVHVSQYADESRGKGLNFD